MLTSKAQNKEIKNKLCVELDSQVSRSKSDSTLAQKEPLIITAKKSEPPTVSKKPLSLSASNGNPQQQPLTAKKSEPSPVSKRPLSLTASNGNPQQQPLTAKKGEPPPVSKRPLSVIVSNDNPQQQPLTAKKSEPSPVSKRPLSLTASNGNLQQQPLTAKKSEPPPVSKRPLSVIVSNDNPQHQPLTAKKSETPPVSKRPLSLTASNDNPQHQPLTAKKSEPPPVSKRPSSNVYDKHLITLTPVCKAPLVPSSSMGHLSSAARTPQKELEDDFRRSLWDVNEWKEMNSTNINILAINWFHPNLTRHQSEAELGHSEEGVYLLRQRIEDGKFVTGCTLDVRSTHSVKHFKINVIGDSLFVGMEPFHDLDSFLSHFDTCPVLDDGSGQAVDCKYPFPREIDEHHDYSIITHHFLPQKSKISRINCQSAQPMAYSLVSKEGYMVKQGVFVKSWKRRWFSLENNELSYYTNPKNDKPIKVILLKDITEVSACEDTFEKPNTFRLVTPSRTFLLQAPSPTVQDEWIYVLQFKLRELDESKQRSKTEQQCRPNRYD